MPRARNIKPSFFANDLLAENDPLGRLLFIGLWTLADYKGDLEWRARRIKAQILPYDDCDIRALAINLDKSGFIRFYSNGENIYLRIVNFGRHQNPHKNERQAGSEIPELTDERRQAIDLEGLTIIRDKSGSKREDSASDPADSCFLIPDSGSLSKDPPVGPPEGDAKPAEQKSKSAKPKASPTRRRRLPADFELTDHRRQLALNYWSSKNRLDLDPEEEFEKFQAHHRAHGKTMDDWDAAWQTWYANAIKFNRPPPNQPPPGGPSHEASRRTGTASADFTRTDTSWAEGFDPFDDDLGPGTG